MNRAMLKEKCIALCGLIIPDTEPHGGPKGGDLLMRQTARVGKESFNADGEVVRRFILGLTGWLNKKNIPFQQSGQVDESV